jgi:hypothetical protein
MNSSPINSSPIFYKNEYIKSTFIKNGDVVKDVQYSKINDNGNVMIRGILNDKPFDYKNKFRDNRRNEKRVHFENNIISIGSEKSTEMPTSCFTSYPNSKNKNTTRKNLNKHKKKGNAKRKTMSKNRK